MTITGDATITPVISPDTSLNTEGSIIGLIDSATEYICVEQLSCGLDWVHGKYVEYNWTDKDNYYLHWEDNETYYNLYLKALIDAARRGVDVKVILDSAFVDARDLDDNDNVVEYLNEVARLEGLNIEAKLYYSYNLQGKSRYVIIHNKGVIVDGEKVLVSSINWVLGSVGRNREMGLIIENRDVAGYYQQVFDFDWGIDIAETFSAEALYTTLQYVENGTDTGFAIRIKNLGDSSGEIGLSQVWLTDIVTTEAPSGISASLEVETLTLAPGETRDIVLEFYAPEKVNTTLNQSFGVRVHYDGYYADLVFVTVVVKNLTGIGSNGTGEDDETDKEKKTSYTLPVILGIIILILLIVVFAMVRDKIKAAREPEPEGEREESPGEDEDEEKPEDKEEEPETTLDEDLLSQLESQEDDEDQDDEDDEDDEDEFDEELIDDLGDEIDEELLGELDLEDFEDPDEDM